MFVVSIFGGLGSQMDQYAFSLSLRNAYPDTVIKYDIFQSYITEHNGYELKRVFNIDLSEASNSTIAALSNTYPRSGKYYKLMRRIFRLRYIIFGSKESFITTDDNSAFYPEIYKLNPLKSYIFYGNWVSDLYKKGIKDSIREAFTFPEFTDDKNIETANSIINSNSVSIHVRRGDYQAYKFPVLTLDYYKEAISIIREKVENPRFYIFTNDIEWVKENFDFLGNYVIVTHNQGANAFRDMQLMTLCKHNINANSGFSYWGAWLNSNPNKMVISPRNCVHGLHYPFGEPTWIYIDNEMSYKY